MERLSVLFLAFCLCLGKGNATFNLGYCSIACNGEGGVAQSGSTTAVETVPTGGEQGATNEAAGSPSCACPEVNTFASRLKSAEKSIRDLRHLSLTSQGWYKGKTGLFYKLFPVKVGYIQARTRCADVGARLASTTFRNETTRNEIVNALLKPRRTYTWIGLDDLQVRRQWKWSDGQISNTKNTNWTPGQPNEGNERCAHMHYNVGQIYDTLCKGAYDYICEGSF